jgi:hypothetical protein
MGTRDGRAFCFATVTPPKTYGCPDRYVREPFGSTCIKMGGGRN